MLSFGAQHCQNENRLLLRCSKMAKMFERIIFLLAHFLFSLDAIRAWGWPWQTRTSFHIKNPGKDTLCICRQQEIHSQRTLRLLDTTSYAGSSRPRPFNCTRPLTGINNWATNWHQHAGLTFEIRSYSRRT